ncbi:hypothetical protein BSKO_01588 [Bryopsis sp. KO-2023]|nr:hypothetical protein BSKO_01588 [Bryopsis sp. KO-2023]
MVRRRDYTQLGGAPRGSWKNSPYFASFVGVLVGVGLGSLVTLSLFAWLPRDSPGEGVGAGSDLANFQTLHSALPDVRKDGDSANFQTLHSALPDVKHRIIEPPSIKSVDGYNTSNEGTRVLSDFERYGGWRMTPEVLEVAKRHPRAKVISTKSPLLLLIENFMTTEETEHLVQIAKTHMGRSRVVADKNKKGEQVSQARTSFGAWLSNQWRDSVVQNIEKRIHDTVGIPHEFGEGMYVLRYEQTQKYDPHTDNCARRFEEAKEACMNFTKRARGPRCGEGHGGASCGDRAATFIVYLRSPTKGGGTVFPNAELSKLNLASSRRAGASFGSGAKGWYCNDPLVLKVNPKPGDAVLFWDYVPRADVADHKNYPRSGGHDTTNSDTEAADDSASLHGGCPVEEGEKWIVTRWIRTAKFT